MDYKEQFKHLLHQIIDENNKGVIPMVVEESLREVCPEVMPHIDLGWYNVYFKNSTMKRYAPLFSEPRSRTTCENYIAEYKKRFNQKDFQIRKFK